MFLKGVSRPPFSKYMSTWDVDVVLSYLSGLPDNDQLTLQTLAHKLAMLMALDNADRCSDLAEGFRTFEGGGGKLIIPGLTQTRRYGPPIEAFYPAFSENLKLCPLQTLRAYEQRMQDM